MPKNYKQHHKDKSILLYENPVSALAPVPPVEEPDFNRLLQHVGIARDRAAFVAIFDHFAPRVKGYLMRGGFPEVEAEEIAQETMLQVWQKAVFYDAKRASASTWIYTIARNKKIDRLRKHKPVMMDIDNLARATDEAIDTEGESMEIFLNQKRLAERLTDAIKSLPEEQAELVQKAFFEDMSHADIAAATDIPLGTVKSRLRLGLARLRRAVFSQTQEAQTRYENDKGF